MWHDVDDVGCGAPACLAISSAGGAPALVVVIALAPLTMRRLRHQLTAYSPLPTAAVCRALVADATGIAAAGRVQRLLSNRFRAEASLLTGSGSMALQLALELAAERRSARAVALPAFGCYQVASAAHWVAERRGLRIAFYDIDPATLAPDWPTFDASLADAEIAVVVSLFGMPIDWDSAATIATRHGTTIIEDAAQGNGASWHGAPLGAWGGLSILSFGRAKGWTGVSGGALLARGDWARALLELDIERCGLRARARHAVAMTAQWSLARPWVYGVPASLPMLGLGETRYSPAEAPMAMSPGACSLIAASQSAAEREAAGRRAAASEWQRELGGLAGTMLYATPERSEAGYLRFPLLLSGGMNAFPDPGEARRMGIAATYPTTLPVLPAMRHFSRKVGDWPGAELLVRKLVTLPTHGRVSARDRERVLRLVAAAVRAGRVAGAESPEPATLHPASESCAESRVP